MTGTATAADWPGVWHATWPNDHQTELTIVRIDDDNARGAYCHLTNDGRTSYIDLHPDAVLAELDNTADDVLRIERPSRRWTFRLDAGADVVNMRFEFGDRPANEINLARVEAQTCAARIQQLTPLEPVAAAPAIAALVPHEPDHWAVGVWTVTNDDLSVDLAVLDVADGYARGLSCNVREGTLGFHDLDPDHGIRAKATRTKLTFKIRDTRFSFKRTKNPDVLKGTRVQHLAAFSMDGQPPGQPRFEIMACIAGRGFGLRRGDLRTLLLATRGKTFTVQHLCELLAHSSLAKFRSSSTELG